MSSRVELRCEHAGYLKWHEEQRSLLERHLEVTRWFRGRLELLELVVPVRPRSPICTTVTSHTLNARNTTTSQGERSGVITPPSVTPNNNYHVLVFTPRHYKLPGMLQ